MSVQVENLEHNMAKLTITVDSAELDKAIEKAYNREKNRIQVRGFRKGKAPRKLIEAEYGKDVFYEGAANILIQSEYPRAYDESGLEIVSSPEIDITQLEAGKDFIFTADVAVKPEVKLGAYEGVEVTSIDTSVSDEDVDKEIEAARRQNSRSVESDKAAEKGDTTDINFEGFIDDVPFEGGKGENFKLKLGSGSFIDNFEDQLVGSSAGDDVDVNVTFPENYQASELAGKKALFKVHVNSVLKDELPELDEDFASDQGFDSVDEYKADVRKNLEKTRSDSARRTQEDEAVAKVADGSEMDIPDAMIKTQSDSMMNEMAQNFARQGLTMQQYFQFTGTTAEQLREQIKPDAEKRIRHSLVLEAIAKEKGFEISEDEYEKEIEKMAEQYGMKADDIKKHISDTDKKNIEDDLKVQKAVDYIMDNAKFVEKSADSEKKTEEN